MKRVILTLIIIVICLLNLTIIMEKPSNASQTLLSGLKGVYLGKFICHCPDDAQTCYCNN